MLKYFDKTFFKFLAGFLLILILSFVAIYLVQMIEEEPEPDTDVYVNGQLYRTPKQN